MKKIVIVILILVLLIVGFSYQKNKNVGEENVLVGKVSSTQTLMVNGLERNYIIYIPSGVSKNAPVVFVFHGGGSTAQDIKENSGYDFLADREKFIVVYPEGYCEEKLKKACSWNNGPIGGGASYENNIDDLAFIDAVISDVSEKYSVDKKRFYATGISMGGMMSHQLACKRSEVFAAVAPIASAMVTPNCNPSRAVPVIHFHGTEDKFVPYEGGDSYDLPDSLVVGGNYPSVYETIYFWSENNECADSRVSYEQGDVICEINEGCIGNASVELCTIEGGGHTWPGSEPLGKLLQGILGEVTQDISATESSWTFFKQYKLN